MASPQPEKSLLYGYQRNWVADAGRFCLAVKSRQIGFTFATTLKHVRRRISRGGLTVWISASERQSVEAIEYVKVHNEAVQQAFDYAEVEFPGVEEKAKQVTYRHNGARIMAMPANPKTIRGFSGDVVLDEFAFHRDPLQIWRGAMAIVSRGHSLDVVSTPNGQSGKYWDLCRDAGVSAMGDVSDRVRRNQSKEIPIPNWTAKRWSIHWCDIYSAVAQGCPIDPEAMREAAGDEDTWLQEYCCTFLADAENYIPLELVIACESENATLEMPAEFIPQGPLYLGIDIGRKKDRTVIWLKEKVGDVLWTRAVTVLERTPFRAQFSIIDSLLAGVSRACVDATGLGMQLAEELAMKWGSKVEPVTFNLENKEKMATAQKAAFEERRERIPGAPFIRRSINAVKRFTSTTGHFRFDADRTDQGHADEFWACALATAAAQQARPAVYASADAVPEQYEAQGAMSRIMQGIVDREARGGQEQPAMGRGERESIWHSRRVA